MRHRLVYGLTAGVAAAVLLGFPAPATAAPSPPGAPTMNAPIVYRSDAVQVKWGYAPSHGAAVTGYIVAHDGINAASQDVAPTVRSFTFAQLTAGRTYHFSVTATSAVGNSPTVTTTVNLTPSSVPGAPVIISTTVFTNAAIQVKWGYAPKNASPVTAYVLTRDTACVPTNCEDCDGQDNFYPPPCDIGQDVGPSEPQPVTVSASTRAYTFDGLWAGHTYHFTVAGVNAFGTGPPAPAAATATVSPLSLTVPSAVSFTQTVTPCSPEGPCITAASDLIGAYTIDCPKDTFPHIAGIGGGPNFLRQSHPTGGESELIVLPVQYETRCTGAPQQVPLELSDEDGDQIPFVTGDGIMTAFLEGLGNYLNSRDTYLYPLRATGPTHITVTTVVGASNTRRSGDTPVAR